MFQTIARRRPHRLSPILVAFLTIALGLTFTVGSQLRPPSSAAAEDDEVVLPGRVAAAINRTLRSVDRAEAAIDDDRPLAARTALAAVAENLRRANSAGLHQLDAVPADEEAETTPGPDSIVAVLNLDQAVIIQLSTVLDNLFHRGKVVGAVNHAMSVAHNQRQKVLKNVIGLDPEGAGADYADGMADTVDGYADEVAVLAEALKYDRLAPAGLKGLTSAHTRAIATQKQVTAAFGGGE